MQRTQILAITLILLALVFYYGVNFIYSDKPREIHNLDKRIAELNEKLITAQILANKLDRVYTLFESNLALDKQDSLAEDASIPFLATLTKHLDSLGIQVRNIRPRLSVEARSTIETPYELDIRCNYRQLGELMAELERSPRLITLREFHVKNGVERLKTTRDERLLAEQDIELKLYTLTLVKGE